MVIYFRNILFLFFGLFAGHCISQKEAFKWYFGDRAALDFTTSPPTSVTGSSLYALEGCASIADAAGNLLFYTNGNVIRNKTHQLMANGGGLLAWSSSNQTSVIAKQPGNSNIYYVFTQGASGGMRYSVVDMNLAVGMGSVTVKNAMLFPSSTEMLCAAFHCNGKDVWVISHDYFSNNFRAHLLTATGVPTTAVVSSIGSPIYIGFGNIKVSPSGKKLGMIHYNDSVASSAEVFDFDNATGVISNSLSLINFPYAGSSPFTSFEFYSCEFSPDGTKFYASRPNRMFQWDLCAGNGSLVAASQFSFQVYSIMGLQLAPNGKIYSPVAGLKTLGVMHQPNIAGAGCTWQDTALSVAPNTCASGLPNFVSGYLRPKPAMFTSSNNTLVSCNTFTFNASVGPTVNTSCSASGYSVNSILWSFGDPGSGASNTSTVLNPVHAFSGSGNYLVELVYYYNCGTDTLRQIITVGPSLTFSANPGFSICAGETVTLTAGGGDSYSWSNAVTGNTIVVSPPLTTSYTVVGTDASGFCFASKTVTITVDFCLMMGSSGSYNHFLKMFPNPSHDKICVETFEDGRLWIYNQLGSLVLEQDVAEGKNFIDLSLFTGGIYFVKAVFKDRLMVRKIIKD